MNVLYIVADTEKEYNSANWRCDMPMEAINRLKGHQAKKLFIKDWVESEDKSLSEWADVIVLQRNAVAGALWSIAEWRARGKKVLIDLDDGYEYMPQSLVSAQFWINRQTTKDGKAVDLPFDPIEHLHMGLKLCTAITTPSSVIVQDRLPLNKALLVPNYPKTDMYINAARRYNETKQQTGRITIGWGGGGSHFDSFMNSNLMPALVRVMEKRPNVDLLIMGPVEIGTILGNKNKMLRPRIKAEKWGAYSAWHDRLARLDIALAPLYGNYDKRRSWLKGIEYTLECIPWVGTDYETNPQPYSQFQSWHLVRNQAKQWEAQLLDMVDNLEEYRGLMTLEQEWARQFDLFDNAGKIIETYAEA